MAKKKKSTGKAAKKKVIKSKPSKPRSPANVRVCKKSSR